MVTSLLIAAAGVLLATVLSLVPALHIYNVAGFVVLATTTLEGQVPPENLAMLFLGMITGYTLRSEGPGGLLRQAGVGLNMFKKGKLRLLPPSLRAPRQVRNIFRQTEGKG